MGLRTWLSAGVVVVLMVALGPLRADGVHASARPPIVVGNLHSQTGSVAVAERPITDATMMAIDEINARGGVLGRQVRPIAVDGRSDWPTFAAEAERLIANEHVRAIFGCYTSASRRTIVPIIERHHNLLLYPTFYEGIEQSPNVVYTGGTANQNTTPAVKWFMENRGKSFFLVGSDYIYPRATNAVVKDQINYLGGQILGEEYLPLGRSDFGPIVARLVAAKPQVILSTVVGDSNVGFFQALRAAGVDPHTTPTLSLVVGEADLQSLNGKEMAGTYVAMNYFQSIDSPENVDFVRRFKAKFGLDRVVTDPMESAYASVYLWAQAAEKAGTDEPEAVLSAIRGMDYAAPEGLMHIDAENLHSWKTARIAQITPTGELSVEWTSETVLHPSPYTIYRTRRQWNELVHELYVGWGGGWAAP